MEQKLEIIPCRFCGSECFLEEYEISYYAECRECGATGPREETPEKAIYRHNGQKLPSKLSRGAKPCPYCGGYDLPLVPSRNNCHYVQCRECGATGPISNDVDDARWLYNEEHEKWSKEPPTQEWSKELSTGKDIYCEGTYWFYGKVYPSDGMDDYYIIKVYQFKNRISYYIGGSEIKKPTGLWCKIIRPDLPEEE